MIGGIVSHANEAAAVSKQQYLSGSDGTHWVPLDANGLSVTIAPTVTGTAVLRVSADLWTTASRDNQDFGVFASVNGGAETLVGWKESGGWGTYSPNASFAQATYGVSPGNTYRFTLKWKANQLSPPGATLYAGAGPIGGDYSPTSLIVDLVP